MLLRALVVFLWASVSTPVTNKYYYKHFHPLPLEENEFDLHVQRF